MKICPQCQNTYEDETLNFCLDDGSVLTFANTNRFDPPDTVEFNRTPQTDVNQNIGTNQNWNSPAQFRQNSGGGSKSWLWVVGILLALVVLCGGGFAGLIALGIYSDTTDGDGSRTLVKSSDFSNWKFDSDQYIKAENKNGKLVLSTQDNYYYVFIFKEFPTYDASVKVTVKNESGRKTVFGYGLVVNSHPTRILTKDYAFLIDSNSGEYRVVKHTNQAENDIVKWTDSQLIKKGSQPNDLEVRIYGTKMDFYINNEFVRTVTDSNDYKEGVAGVYTSDQVPITFTNLELRK